MSEVNSQTVRRAEPGAQPHLSVVAVSRNDNHGGDMLGRMQHFIDGFISQCRRHGLAAELILVEWNPPADRPPLADALKWPSDTGPASIRIVTLPQELHARLDHAGALPLFQMIGKNVGIRRARGRFVLATNIDILMNDALIRYMRDSLLDNTIVRIDRFDVPENVPHDPDFENVLAFCDANFFRVATPHGIYHPESGSYLGTGGNSYYQRKARIYARQPGLVPERLKNVPARPGSAPESTAGRLQASVKRALWLTSKLWPPQKIPIRAYWLVKRWLPGNLLSNLHTHACGDFTLLSRDDWFRLRGYPEWPIYSLHIDSLFMCMAAASGMKEVALPPEYRSYHIEHDAGSGWTPEAEQKLFERLTARGIPFLSYEDLVQWADRCSRDPSARVLNDENWGFGSDELADQTVAQPAATPRAVAP